MMNGLDFWLDFLAKNSRSLKKELNQNPSPKISGFLDFLPTHASVHLSNVIIADSGLAECGLAVS